MSFLLGKGRPRSAALRAVAQQVSLIGTLADQRALEFGEYRKNAEDQLAGCRLGVDRRALPALTGLILAPVGERG
jgi:hypothetical protein